MRGRTKSRLMCADDGNYYVVKFQNNPLGRRALINDWLASKIAVGLGLEVAKPEIVQVPDWMLRIASQSEINHVDAGPQFGSRFVAHPQRGQVVDYFPESWTNASHLTNPDFMAGALVFDLWLRNVDYRQFVYYRTYGEKLYTAVMIDQTGCFGGTDWHLRPSEMPALQGAYVSISAEMLEHWISRIRLYPEQAALRML